MKYSKLIIFCMALLVASELCFGLYVNEIMYNPIGTDSGKEFIELYNEELTKLENFTIGDVYKNNTLKLKQFFNSTLILIVSEGFNITTNVTEYVVKEIGSGLNNGGDKIWLYDKEMQLILNFSYIDSAPEGKSLEFNGSVYLPSLVIGGTHGIENSVLAAPTTTSSNESEENRTLSNKQSNEGNTTKLNSTETAETDYEYIEACNLTIITSKVEYKQGETVNFRFNASTKFQDIEYYLEDQHGDIAKAIKFTKNLKQKSWKAKTNEYTEVFTIHAKLHSETCQAEAIKDITVHNDNPIIEDEYFDEEDDNTIKKVKTKETSQKKFNAWLLLGSDKMARFGGTLSVRVSNHDNLGDPLKIKIYNEKLVLLSAVINANKSTIKLDLPKNCDNKFDEGIYIIDIDGEELIKKEVPIYSNKDCIKEDRHTLNTSTIKIANATNTTKNSKTKKIAATDNRTGNRSPEVYNSEVEENASWTEFTNKKVFNKDLLWYGLSSLGIIALLVIIKSKL